MRRICLWLLCGIWIWTAPGCVPPQPAPTPAAQEKKEEAMKTDETILLQKALHCTAEEAAIVAEEFGYLQLGKIVSAKALDSDLSAYVLSVRTADNKTYVLYVGRNYALEAVIRGALGGEFIYRVLE